MGWGWWQKSGAPVKFRMTSVKHCIKQPLMCIYSSVSFNEPIHCITLTHGLRLSVRTLDLGCGAGPSCSIRRYFKQAGVGRL